ncbi:hypothetical protein KCU86_g17557, partial [Aureobasidium melanogenum]
MTVSAMNMVSYCHGKAQGDGLTTWPVLYAEDNRLFASLSSCKGGHSGEMEHPSVIIAHEPAKILETLLHSPYHLHTRQSGSPARSSDITSDMHA